MSQEEESRERERDIDEREADQNRTEHMWNVKKQHLQTQSKVDSPPPVVMLQFDKRFTHASFLPEFPRI